MKKEIFGLDLAELTVVVKDLGMSAFRAKQIFQWIYQKAVFNFADMLNLSKADREKLGEYCQILPKNLAVVKRLDSSDGLTKKFLISLVDGSVVETVLMRHDYGYSVCLSSQVGCGMGCVFCASTLHGCERSLTKEEILAQFYFCNEFLKDTQQHVSRLVVMGSGEPLLNCEGVFGALEFLHNEGTANISYRNMTVSTCGILPGMVKMQALGHPINLAVSLHAVREELRNELMPVNRAYPFLQVIGAAEEYAVATGREITYEYILLAGKNDSVLDAKLLVNCLRFKHATVNLIPANPVPERGWKRPGEGVINRFIEVLNRGHIKSTVRKEMGTDIGAACGQLRNQFVEQV